MQLTERGRAEFALLDQPLLGARARARRAPRRAGAAPARRPRWARSASCSRRPRARPRRASRAPEPGDYGWIISAPRRAVRRRVRLEHAASRRTRRSRSASSSSATTASTSVCWIAEVDGRRAGSIFCTRRDDEEAQLRMLFVEPGARGLGVAALLVDECIAFARAAGYRSIMLWTTSVLDRRPAPVPARGVRAVRPGAVPRLRARARLRVLADGALGARAERAELPERLGARRRSPGRAPPRHRRRARTTRRSPR